MAATLDQIVDTVRAGVAVRKQSADLTGLRHLADAHAPRGFRAALLRRPPSVIAELKKASPSRGLIRKNFSIEELAPELESAGAAALSVLTEEDYFQGSLAYLRAASSVTQLPCLRKDFIVDEFQVLEARANCADAILLIVATLDDGDLIRLRNMARELGLDVLCEVHDEPELERALALDFDIIGVNNRNLRTFDVKLETALRLVSQIPGHLLKVAESGIRSAGDIRTLHAAGYHAFLVGESLMAQARPGAALRELLPARVEDWAGDEHKVAQ